MDINCMEMEFIGRRWQQSGSFGSRGAAHPTNRLPNYHLLIMV